MEVKVDQRRLDILHDPHKFLILVAGRRWGKTWLSLTWLISGTIGANENRFFVAPTYRQGKMVAWSVLKQMLSDTVCRFNETELRVDLPNNSVIRIVGADRADSLRGIGLKRVVLDEFAFMKPDVWQMVILPMLASTNGRALFSGTPSGYNHFHRLFIKATDQKDWGVYEYKTNDGGNVPQVEIDRAREEMDDRTFRQEFEATFESYEGRLYYNFDPTDIVKKSLKYMQGNELWLTCDFNKAPMVWLVCQKLMDGSLTVLEELVIRHNAKTQHLIREFCKKYDHVTNKVLYLTGDASNNYESHRDYSSDYMIIMDTLKDHRWHVVNRVPKKNPNINNRVNVMCSLFHHRKIQVTDQARLLINDFQSNESDGKGAKEKKDPMQTHSSDALDYLIWMLYANDFYSNKQNQQQFHGG